MEFKGTPGPWRLANNEYGYYTSVRNLDNTRKVCVSRVNNQDESNANMVLIAHAPELLEMINELHQLLEENQGEAKFYTRGHHKCITDLLTRATTI